MACKYCKARGKTWSGDDPRCAFPTGVFTSDNWNCAAMNYLRQISETNGNHGRDDDSAGSIGFVRANNDYASDDYDGLGGYVVMAWYKNRGGTGNAHFMDDNETHLLTIDHVDMALATNRFDMEAI